MWLNSGSICRVSSYSWCIFVSTANKHTTTTIEARKLKQPDKKVNKDDWRLTDLITFRHFCDSWCFSHPLVSPPLTLSRPCWSRPHHAKTYTPPTRLSVYNDFNLSNAKRWRREPSSLNWIVLIVHLCLFWEAFFSPLLSPQIWSALL